MITLLIKRLLILFISLSACWFGLKFYAEREITEKLNKFALLASPQAIIRFEATTVHATGKISLSNLEVTPINISEDPFYAERASVIFPNTFEMIKLIYNVEMGHDFQLPNSLRLLLDGINDPLMNSQGVYANAIDNLNNQLKEQFSHITAPLCGENYFIGPKEFSKMGINSLITGVFWEYNYTPDNQKLGLNFGVNSNDLYTASLKVNIANQKSVGLQDLMQAPQVTSLEILYQDEGLTVATNQYCAKQSGISVDEYIGRIASQPDEYYLIYFGVIPNEAMKKAYLDFLKKPDSISITSHLPPAFNPATLAAYDIEHWVSLLGLSLKVNNKAVTPFEINLPDPSGFMDNQADDFEISAETRNNQETTEQAAMDTGPKIETERAPAPASRQIATSSVTIDKQPAEEKRTALLHRQKPPSGEIPVYQLSDYIGHQIEVTMERSKRFTGELLAVDQEALVLKIRVGSGTITMPVSHQRIESVKSR